MTNKIEQIIQKAEDTYQTAKFGYEDLVRPDRKRRFSGLRNLVVFGRSVTFVLQNLKTPLGEDSFNKWYLPNQERMKNDILMKYFVKLRNEILKEGKLPLSVSVEAKQLNLSDLQSRLGTPPPGAVGYFIGDKTGGSGWEIELPDGSKIPYYVGAPEDMVKVTQHFSELPVPDDDELKKEPIEHLCQRYLLELEKLIDSAREEFLGSKAQKVKGRRLPPYIRVVK